MAAKKESTVLEHVAEEPSTALAPIDAAPDTEVALAAPSYSTSTQFDPEDISFPRLKLLQGISQEVMDPESTLKAGQWHITGDEDGRKEVVFIPQAYSLSRRYQVGTGDDKQTLCQSSDGVTGVGTPGGSCKACPLAQWGEDPETGRRVLACQPSYNYIGHVPEYGVVAMSLSRTASPTAKTLNGFLAIRKFGNFGVKLTASQVKGGDKTYFVPTMKIAKLTQEELDNAKLDLG